MMSFFYLTPQQYSSLSTNHHAPSSNTGDTSEGIATTKTKETMSTEYSFGAQHCRYTRVQANTI